jgi:hypothetical protein
MNFQQKNIILKECKTIVINYQLSNRISLVCGHRNLSQPKIGKLRKAKIGKQR